MRFLPSLHAAARLLPLRPLIKFIYPGLAFRHVEQLRKPLPIRSGGSGKMALSLSLRPGGVGRFNSAKRPVKTGEHRAPVRASTVDCPTNIVSGHPVKVPCILGGFITAIKKVKSPLAFATVKQKFAIVAEVVGVLRVGVDGAFLEGFGGIVVAANIGEEVSVVAEDVGLLGVGVDGVFTEGFGGIVVAANIGEEDGVVA